MMPLRASTAVLKTCQPLRDQRGNNQISQLTHLCVGVLVSIKVTPEVTADKPTDLPKSAPSTSGMTTKVVKGSAWTLAGSVLPLSQQSH